MANETSDSPFNFGARKLNEITVDTAAMSDDTLPPEFPPDERDAVVPMAALAWIRDQADAVEAINGPMGCFIAIRCAVDVIIDSLLVSHIPGYKHLNELTRGVYMTAESGYRMSSATSKAHARRMAREVVELVRGPLLQTLQQDAMIEIFADKIWHMSQAASGFSKEGE